METKNGALSEVIGELRQATPEDGEGEVTVGDLIDALDERGYGPALAVLPLLELTPIGGIPGVPTALALIIAGLTLRLFLGYEHLWAPGFLRRRKLSAEKVEKSLDWLQPVALRIDAKLHERLRRFADRKAQRIACIVILLLLLTVPPLELIPFATSAPMIVISIFGLGILFRDGLLMLVGFAGAAVAVVVIAWLGLSGGGG